MSHVLVAVLPMDTQLDDAVRALQKAGLADIGFIARDPSSDQPQLAGFSLQPTVMAVLQMLAPDGTVTVEGLGRLTVSGTAATVTGQTTADFLNGVFGHAVDDNVASGLARSLKDGHVLLSVGGDTDKARSTLQRYALAFH